ELKSKCSVSFQVYEAKAPNQEAIKEQVLRKRGLSGDRKAGSCSHELLDGCLSKTGWKISEKK
ncbi:unnamed protein product, partial [Hymenolepis diminuta]